MSKNAEMKKLLVEYVEWQVSRLKRVPLGKKGFRHLIKEVEEFVVQECDNATSGLMHPPDCPLKLLKVK